MRTPLDKWFVTITAALAMGSSTIRAEIDVQQWKAAWEKEIQSDRRYCDDGMGEDLAWLISPFLNGYYEGYRATGDEKWVEKLMDWTDALLKRGVKEPDGYIGWPKEGGDGTQFSKGHATDSLVGEAMVLRPVVLMAGEILKTPALKAKYGDKANAYIKTAEQQFEKWDKRCAWREVKAGDKPGGLWINPQFWFDRQTNQWTPEYSRKESDGFSNPDNKLNEIALWMMAMHDVTGNPVYRERAEKWFQLMKSRMRLQGDGKYYVWNYWDVGGPWDLKPDGSPKHWVGIHPRAGYYSMDVKAIVAAYEHGLVFQKADMDRLIATNRDFMWDKQIENAKFGRIDGGTQSYQGEPIGTLWTALVPYDETLRKIFEANHKPGSWGGISATPWYLAYLNSKKP